MGPAEESGNPGAVAMLILLNILMDIRSTRADANLVAVKKFGALNNNNENRRKEAEVCKCHDQRE